MYRRLSLILSGFLLCSLSLFLSPQVHAMTSASWPMFGYDASHSKYNPYETQLSTSNVSRLALAWKGTPSNVYEASAVVALGYVYFVDGDGIVTAYNEQTGTVAWSKRAPGSGLASSAPVATSTILYVGGYDQNNNGVIYALNVHTGATVWQKTLQTGGSFALQSALTYADNVLYATWSDGHLRAINATTGKEIWNQLLYSSYSSPVVANGVVYVTGHAFNSPTYLYAVNASNGAIIWKTLVDSDAGITSAPVLGNGLVYVDDQFQHHLSAYNTTNGNKSWTYTADAAFYYSSPAIANGVLYAPSNDGIMHALDATTGTQLWSYSATGSIDSSPAVANGVIYFTTTDGYIYALNTQGQQLWSYTVSTGEYLDQSSPAVIDGMLFIGDSNYPLAFHVV